MNDCKYVFNIIRPANIVYIWWNVVQHSHVQTPTCQTAHMQTSDLIHFMITSVRYGQTPHGQCLSVQICTQKFDGQMIGHSSES